MSAYAIITQNDESKWDDIKGELYNYPSTYQAILTRGCKVIYYKGKMKNRAFAPSRLSPGPHYFGIGEIGDSIVDEDSSKGDRYWEIIDYHEFEEAVAFKDGGEYLETIPESKTANYWRWGVREISKATHERICSRAVIRGYQITLPNSHGEHESFHPTEGNKKARYTSYYERNPFNRSKAIEIHGLGCMVCGFNFEDTYGVLGKGFIHVHRNKAISESGPTRINPRTDMSVLCPNCHAMVHRKRDTTLSLEELLGILNG